MHSALKILLIVTLTLQLSLSAGNAPPQCFNETKVQRYTNTGNPVPWPLLTIHFGTHLGSTTLNTIAYILFREKLGFEVEFYPPLDITNVENWDPYWAYHENKTSDGSYVTDYIKWVNDGKVNVFGSVKLGQMERIMRNVENTDSTDTSVYMFGLSEFDGMFIPAWAEISAATNQNDGILDFRMVFEDQALLQNIYKTQSGKAAVLVAKEIFEQTAWVRKFLKAYEYEETWEVEVVGSAESLLIKVLELVAQQKPFIVTAGMPSIASAYVTSLQRRTDECPKAFLCPQPGLLSPDGSCMHPQTGAPIPGMKNRCFTKIWVPEPQSGRHDDPCIQNGKCQLPEWSAVGFINLPKTYSEFDIRQIDEWRRAMAQLFNFMSFDRGHIEEVSRYFGFGGKKDMFTPVCTFLKQHEDLWKDGLVQNIDVKEFQEDDLPKWFKTLTIALSICSMTILFILLCILIYSAYILKHKLARRFSPVFSSIWLAAGIACTSCMIIIVDRTKNVEFCMTYQWVRQLTSTIIFVIPALKAWRIATIFSGEINTTGDHIVRFRDMVAVLTCCLIVESVLVALYDQYVEIENIIYDDDYLTDWDCNEKNAGNVINYAFIGTKFCYIFAIIYYAWQSRRAWSKYKETSWLMFTSFFMIALWCFYLLITLSATIKVQRYIRIFIHWIIGFAVPVTYFSAYLYSYLREKKKKSKFEEIELESGLAENIMNRLENMPLKQVEWFDRQYNRYLTSKQLDGSLEQAGYKLKMSARKRGITESVLHTVDEPIFLRPKESNDQFVKHKTWHGGDRIAEPEENLASLPNTRSSAFSEPIFTPSDLRDPVNLKLPEVLVGADTSKEIEMISDSTMTNQSSELEANPTMSKEDKKKRSMESSAQSLTSLVLDDGGTDVE